MFGNTIQKKIKETVQDLFKKMTFDVDVEVLPKTESGSYPVNIKTENPQVIIGEGGQTLMDLQHILKLILKRKLFSEGVFYIDLDINSYKKKKIEYLKEMARNVADDVSLSKKDRELSPMSSYERRIVHMELAGRSDVISESIGEGPERRIVVKPRP